MAKYYVVWSGKQPGLYTTWPECERQVKGVAGALYKSYKTEAEARAAMVHPPAYVTRAQERASRRADDAAKEGAEKPAATPRRRKASKPRQPKATAAEPLNPPDWRSDTVLPLPPEVTADAWAVDAACSGNPGPMEYRGVDLATGAEVFRIGPLYGTNNIGEFLAIVHALALLKRAGETKTIYSDSRNAQLWVRAGKCRTKLASNPRTAQALAMATRAEAWLAANDWSDIPLVKWQTSRWGEIPADFGRK